MPGHYPGVGWDHPRAYGEKREFARFEPLNLGSPPRMRGKEATARM